MTQSPVSPIRATKGRAASPRHPWRRGRVLALQVLFELDLTSHDWRVSLDAHAEEVRASAAVESFAASRIEGVVDNRAELDDMVRRHAPMWPVEQLSAVDRNVLRMALFELRQGSSTPPKVAINEAVELAKEFGGEGSARFVNGVLGASLDELTKISNS